MQKGNQSLQNITVLPCKNFPTFLRSRCDSSPAGYSATSHRSFHFGHAWITLHHEGSKTKRLPQKIWCTRTLWKVGQGMMSFNTTVVTRNSFWLFKWGGRRRLLSIHTFLVVLLFRLPFSLSWLTVQKSSPKYWGQELAKRGCKSHTKHTNICTLPLSVLSPSSPYFWLYCTRCIFKEVEMLFDLFLIALTAGICCQMIF